jgi:hypothetical protein
VPISRDKQITVRETGFGNVRLEYGGDYQSRVSNEVIPTFRMNGHDNVAGCPIYIDRVSIPYLKMLHDLLGDFLGRNEPTEQVVTIRVVHVKPKATKRKGRKVDNERKEIDAIKERMMKR